MMINKIISLINELPEQKLSTSLLKAKILAYKIKNSKFIEWVDNELNGYEGKEVPAYRLVPTAIFGDLIQVTNQGIITRNDYPLPYEGLEKKLRDALKSYGVMQSVSELEDMLEKNEKHFIILIPYSVSVQITKSIKNGWEVDKAWMKFSRSSITGIISSIKSTLLIFLLELTEEIGKEEDIDIKEHEENIDSLFDKTIGAISAEKVNIFIGEGNIQSISDGDNAHVNIAKGENVQQTINVENQERLNAFIEELKDLLQSSELEPDDKEDIENEITRVETQLNRAKPKYLIVKEALLVIHGILMGVSSNVITNPLLGELASILTCFGIGGI